MWYCAIYVTPKVFLCFGFRYRYRWATDDSLVISRDPNENVKGESHPLLHLCHDVTPMISLVKFPFVNPFIE